MAEYIAKDIIEKQGLSQYFEITSAATSREEIGNDIYPPAMRALQSHGIRYDRHSARQITNDDYINNDYIIAMDKAISETLINILTTGRITKSAF